MVIGWGDVGTFLNDLYSFVAPAAVVWADNSGPAAFISVYDWDVIQLGTMVIPGLVDLCVNLFPCGLSLVGAGGGRILRIGNASFRCDASAGCTGIVLDSVLVECGMDVSAGPVVRVSGSQLLISNATFANCTSSSDGTAILAFAANVKVTNSDFDGLSTAGDGGAISVVGGSLAVLHSNFRGCEAAGVGGAVSASAFQCSGATNVTLTTVDIEDSTFEGCSAGGFGGALAASSAVVQVEVYRSLAQGCSAGGGGGAFFAAELARLSLQYTWLMGNTAGGGGGGGLHCKNAPVVLNGVSGIGNTAMIGGGGVVYWQGFYPPAIVDWCPAGTWAAAASNCSTPACQPVCTPCEAGTFQSAQAATACTLCAAGTFSSNAGATSLDACIPCPSGTNSSYTGASSPAACRRCPVGTFAAAGAIACMQCRAGWFGDSLGASMCMSCGTGFFSTAVGASSNGTCVRCPAGSFSTSTAAFTCTLCPSGSYSDAVGATSAVACIGCDVGFYSSAAGAVGVSACTACGAGTFAPRQGFSFSIEGSNWEDAEAACAASGGHLASVDSEAERDQVLGILPEGLDWWIGLRFSITVGDWAWISSGQAPTWMGWGEVNPKLSGSAFAHGCAVMPSYAYSTDSSGSLDAQWPFYVSEFDVVLPSSYYYSNAGAWYNIECADRHGWTNGHICSYRGASACLSCSPGAYSSGSSSTECRMCTAGTYASEAGATACGPCPATGNFSGIEGTAGCDKGARRELKATPSIAPQENARSLEKEEGRWVVGRIGRTDRRTDASRVGN